MPKTPDEIKKGLECCLGDCHNYHCEECPYMNPDTENYDGCSDNGKKLAADALALIQQLEAERDAAVNALRLVQEKHEKADEVIDDEVFPLVDYDVYRRLRDAVDDMLSWEVESDSRGVQKEESDDGKE